VERKTMKAERLQGVVLIRIPCQRVAGGFDNPENVA
jgi:hypothetical protein